MTALREAQAPLKEQYEQDPEQARVTLTATGEEVDDTRACSVDIGRAIYDAELHEGVGGPGTAACSGDLLLGALAACTQLTAQAVAESFGIDPKISVEVDGDLDLRGTLGLGDDVPVGFDDIRLTVNIEGISRRTRQRPSESTRKNTVSCTKPSSTRLASRQRGRLATSVTGCDRTGNADRTIS